MRIKSSLSLFKRHKITLWHLRSLGLRSSAEQQKFLLTLSVCACFAAPFITHIRQILYLLSVRSWMTLERSPLGAVQMQLNVTCVCVCVPLCRISVCSVSEVRCWGLGGGCVVSEEEKRWCVKARLICLWLALIKVSPRRAVNAHWESVMTETQQV